MKVKFYILGIRRGFRGENLLTKLTESGVNAEVIWGFDAKESDIPKEFIDDKKATFLYGRKLTMTEVACTLGHKKILEKSRLDDVDISVILEDDVVISDVKLILHRLKAILLIERPALFFLFTHRRLSLRLPFVSHTNRNLGVQRIYSNPGGAVAYILNRQAIESLADLPRDTWTGVQADFPPLYFEKIKMYTVREIGDNVKLQNIASTIGERDHPNLSLLSKLSKGTDRSFRIFGSRRMRHGLGVRSYCAHFFARGLAWRLNSPVK